MILILSSEKLVFAGAQALLLRKSSPEGGIAEARCCENVISDLNIEDPGTYNLWLWEMDLRVSSRGKSVRADVLPLPWVLEFTQEDLDRGSKTIVAPLGGVFRITVTDAHRLPVPHHKLLTGSDETTTEIQMDANGTRVTYGNPTRCFLLIDPGFAVLIQHLDTDAL